MRYNTKSRLKNRNRNSNNKPNRSSKRKPAKRTNSKNKRSRVRRRTVKGGSNEGAKTPPKITVKKIVDGEEVTETEYAINKQKVGDDFIDTPIRVRNEMFADNKDIISVELGDGIKLVGVMSFVRCPQLQTVKLSEQLNKIGHSAFAHSGVKTINLPKYLETIDTRAFQGCNSLDIIEIPASVRSIGEGAFSECSGLNTLIINYPPKGQELTINRQAFFKCTALSSIEFKGDKGVTTGTIIINQDAFGGCCKPSGLFSSTDVKNLPKEKEKGQILIINDKDVKRVPKDTKEIKEIIKGEV